MKKLTYLIIFLSAATFGQNTVTDIDGNTYNYLTYGQQKWTTENAAMETYRDGTPIPQVTDTSEWVNLTTGAWCYLNNDPNTEVKLYNWFAVVGIHDTDPDTPNKEFAPEGWHVPSLDDWIGFENYLIDNGYNYDGSTTGNKIAKAMASSSGWIDSSSEGAPGNDQNTNNDSEFNAFPFGYRDSGQIFQGQFVKENEIALFWSSTENNSVLGYYLQLTKDFYGSYTSAADEIWKQGGMSVRFLKDIVDNYCKEMKVTRLLNSDNEAVTFEISTDEWHYLAITKSNDLTGKIYLDGDLVGEGTFLDVNYNWSELYLGVSYFTSWRKHFKGWLDEFRVSSIIRSEVEILENFQANMSLEVDANTLGLWHLDEPDGNFFNNSVPGIDDGELFSGAQFTDGRFGNSVYFDGIDDRGDCYIDIPESNVTFEIWLKIQGEEDQENIITPFEAYGLYNTSSDVFDNCDLILDISSTEINSISIHPNPTNNYLFLEGNKNPVSISIYNLFGIEIISTKNTDRVDVSDLSNGIYIISISDGKNLTNKKFIKD